MLSIEGQIAPTNFPVILKCPYCRKWFRVKSDLSNTISNINRHIGKSHAERKKIKIMWVTKSLLAYIREAD